MRWTIIAVVVWLGLAAGLVWAGKANVASRVDKSQMTQDETVEYTIEISGEVSRYPNIQLADLQDFNVYSSGTSQSFTWVNGQSQQSKRYVFRLAPNKSGRLVIPAFALDIDGVRYTTETQVVQVFPARATQQARTSDPNAQRRQQQQQQQQQTGISRDDLFVRTSLDRDTVYVNEQTTLTLRFYNAIELLQNPDYKPPDKTGFWVEDLGQQKTDFQTVNGRDYRVQELKTALFPTGPGVQTIGSAEITCLVQERRRNRDPFSIFDDFGMFGQTKSVKLTSEPLKVVVLPLPEAGKPADFSGAVGQYRISATVDKTKVEANEPVTMTIKIAGTGNIKTVTLPEPPQLADFRSYQAGDSENVERVNYRIGGTKTYEQVFIPKRAGTYVLPSVSLSYFDPAARAYKIISTDPVRLEVAPSTDRFTSQMQNLQSNRIDPTAGAKDIRYLKSEVGNLNSRRSKPLVMSPLFALLYALPIAAYVVIAQQQRRREKLESDQGFRRLKQARKMAEGRLAKAKEHLNRNAADAFYTEISRSLIDYFADRYNLPGFGLTADQIKAFAAGKENDTLIEKMLSLLEQCDFGRFAPGGARAAQMQRMWEEARQLIIDLEKTR